MSSRALRTVEVGEEHEAACIGAFEQHEAHRGPPAAVRGGEARHARLQGLALGKRAQGSFEKRTSGRTRSSRKKVAPIAGLRQPPGPTRSQIMLPFAARAGMPTLVREAILHAHAGKRADSAAASARRAHDAAQRHICVRTRMGARAPTPPGTPWLADPVVAAWQAPDAEKNSGAGGVALRDPLPGTQGTLESLGIEVKDLSTWPARLPPPCSTAAPRCSCVGGWARAKFNTSIRARPGSAGVSQSRDTFHSEPRSTKPVAQCRWIGCPGWAPTALAKAMTAVTETGLS